LPATFPAISSYLILEAIFPHFAMFLNTLAGYESAKSLPAVAIPLSVTALTVSDAKAA